MREIGLNRWLAACGRTDQEAHHIVPAEFRRQSADPGRLEDGLTQRQGLDLLPDGPPKIRAARPESAQCLVRGQPPLGEARQQVLPEIDLGRRPSECKPPR